MTQVEIGSAKLLGIFEQDSPEWHEARASMIGGSDIASVLGLSDWKSGYTLWHEKAGLITPAPRTPEQQRKMDYGHWMEPFVAQQFAKAHPEYQVLDTGTWQHAERAWQGCNPDRLLYNLEADDVTSLLQIKTANYATDYDPEPPAGYMAQVRWEMDTFGFEVGYLAVYFNVGGGYQEWKVTADPFDQDAVRQRAKVFADSLTDGEPPEIDGLESTYQTIRRLNPSIDRGKVADIDLETAVNYIHAVKLAKEVAKEETKWKGHLLAHMGTAQYADYDGKRIASRVAVKDGVPYLKEA